MSLIELKNIGKTYFLGEISVPVLKGISLEIDKGEYVALMGASGSGKSTLMNILGCLDRQTEGDYFFDGEEVGRISGDKRAKIRNKKIGFVFQSFNLLPRTSALDNVIMPLNYTAQNLSSSECRRRGIERLKVVFSPEEPLCLGPEIIEPDSRRRSIPGSTAFVPPAAGLLIAAEVVKDLIS